MINQLYDSFKIMKENLLKIKNVNFYIHSTNLKCSLAAYLLIQSGVNRKNVFFSISELLLKNKDNCFFIVFDTNEYEQVLKNNIPHTRILYDSSLYSLIKSWKIVERINTFDDFISYINGNCLEIFNLIKFNIHKIEYVYNTVSPDSKLIFLQLILKRIFQYSTYVDIYSADQYFSRDIINYSENEVFLDIGAFTGDTIQSFIQSCPNYLQIFAFEPDRMNFVSLVANTNNIKNITYLNCACSDASKFVYFNSNLGAESCISNSKMINSEIRYSLKLDSLHLSPTFIKVDTEGAEMLILNGAKRTISEFYPKLAICIYHHIEDIWEIPYFIHKTFPEYELQIRHHSAYQIESVLYATKRK